MPESQRYTCYQCGAGFRFSGRIYDSIHADSELPSFRHYCTDCAQKRLADRREAERRADLDRREQRQNEKREREREDRRRAEEAQRSEAEREAIEAEEAEEREIEDRRREMARNRVIERFANELEQVTLKLDGVQSLVDAGRLDGAVASLQAIRKQWPVVAETSEVSDYWLKDLKAKLEELAVRHLSLEIQCLHGKPSDLRDSAWRDRVLKDTRALMSGYVAGIKKEGEQAKHLLGAFNRQFPEEYKHFETARTNAFQARRQKLAVSITSRLVNRFFWTWQCFLWVPLTLWCAPLLKLPASWTTTEKLLSHLPGMHLLVLYDQIRLAPAGKLPYLAALFVCTLIAPVLAAKSWYSQQWKGDIDRFISTFDDSLKFYGHSSGLGRNLFLFTWIPLSTIGGTMILKDYQITGEFFGWILVSWIPLFNLQVVWSQLFASNSEPIYIGAYICASIGILMFCICVHAWRTRLADSG